MTREEAIQNINALNSVCGQKDFYDKGFEEALNMAIEALSAEPCEDAISRQAVLDLVVANHTELNGLNVVMYSPLYKDITQLPPVQPIRPKGEWIKRYQYGNDYCSKCNYEYGGYNKINFCPNCGVDMRGEE